MPTRARRPRRSSRPQTERQLVEGIFRAQGLPGWLGWGTYGAETSYGADNPGNAHFFGLIESTYPGIGTPNGELAHDAEIAAKVYAGLVKQYGSVGAAVPHYSGNSYTVSHVRQLAKGGGQGTHAAGSTWLVPKAYQLSPNFVHKLFLLGFGEETVHHIEEVLSANGEPASAYEHRALHGTTTKELEQLVEETEKTPLEAAVESITPANPVQGIADFFSLIVSPAFWLRVGEAIAGAILIYLGIKTLTGLSASELPGAKVATRMAPG